MNYKFEYIRYLSRQAFAEISTNNRKAGGELKSHVATQFQAIKHQTSRVNMEMPKTQLL